MSSTRTDGRTSALLVVMRVSGSGKSTVGAAIAQRLGVPFADADDFHRSEEHTSELQSH